MNLQCLNEESLIVALSPVLPWNKVNQKVLQKQKRIEDTWALFTHQRANWSVFWLQSVDGKDSHTITNILWFWLYSAIIFLCLLLSALLSHFFPFSPVLIIYLYSIPLPPPPPVRMPSCLLVLIFIYRFSSFSLPFLSTDGTLQLASHSASSLTSPRVNAFHVLLPFFCYNIRYFWAFQYREGRLPQRACTTGEQVLVVLCYSKATKVTHFPYTLMKRSWYGSRKLSEKKRCH